MAKGGPWTLQTTNSGRVRAVRAMKILAALASSDSYSKLLLAMPRAGFRPLLRMAAGLGSAVFLLKINDVKSTYLFG